MQGPAGGLREHAGGWRSKDKAAGSLRGHKGECNELEAEKVGDAGTLRAATHTRTLRAQEEGYSSRGLDRTRRALEGQKEGMQGA